jgi:hypothetical protein
MLVVLLILSASFLGVGGTTDGPITVVDITDFPKKEAANKNNDNNVAQRAAAHAAVLACAGFQNRASPETYTVGDGPGGFDEEWLRILEVKGQKRASPMDFLRESLSPALKGEGNGEIRGVVLYNMTAQRTLFPALLTLSGVLGGVPIEETLLDELFPKRNPSNLKDFDRSSLANTPRRPAILFDARVDWHDKSVLEVTRQVFEQFGENTTGMAMMNPGYDTRADPLFPPLTGFPNVGLTDFIIKERLFNFYLNDACIPLTDDYAVMNEICSRNSWPKPIRVFGYNSAWPLFGGKLTIFCDACPPPPFSFSADPPHFRVFFLFLKKGDIFEAETDCGREHNLGQSASEGCSNLGFFSSMPPVTKPLEQNPLPNPPHAFNKSKTYIGLIIGDGDNLSYLKTSRLQWFQQRMENCR